MTDRFGNVAIKAIKHCTCEELYKNYHSLGL